jgi:hypothetical protein
MVSPQIEMRLRGRYHAIEQVLGLLEDIEETADGGEDHRVFQEALLGMEQDARDLAQKLPGDATYYREQVTLFHEASTWPLGEEGQTLIEGGEAD